MSGPRTVVYVADNGLVKVRDGINYRQERVALASDPAVAKYPTDFREVGTVGADGLARILMLGDAATLRLVVDFIAPIGGEAVIPRRGPGRPGWTDDLFRQRWREAVARGNLAEPATYPLVAANFENLDGTMGMDPEWFGRLARKHGTE
jgi:hypothetical protein